MPSISQDGALLCAGKTEIETSTGIFMDVQHPRPVDVNIEDIAHALSLLCRYGGHCETFYSVAEHAILVHNLMCARARERNRFLPDVDRAHALLHDAAEAYLGDVVAPLKKAMRTEEHDRRMSVHAHAASAYDDVSERMDRCIWSALNLIEPECDDEITFCDLWALRIEAHALLPSRGAIWRWPDDIPTHLPDELKPGHVRSWRPGARMPAEVKASFLTLLNGVLP